MSESIPLTSSDGWLLHAILLAAHDGQATLEGLVGAADMINHAMLTFDEIDGGLARLSAAGLVSTGDKRVQITATAAEMQARVAKLSLRKATETLRAELGIPEPVPPFRPTPPDPRWRSGTFTVDDLAKAENGYRQKFRAAYKKPGPAHSA